MIRLPFEPLHGAEYSQPQSEYFSDTWDSQVVANVSKPTLEVFLPEGGGNKTAVIIAPGGGLYALAIETEGRQAARWLAKKGITAFVLCYRLVPTVAEATAQISQEWQADYQQVLHKAGKVLPDAIEDGLAALNHVRENAQKYGVATDKIGMMGFSAGGAVALGVSQQYGTLLSRPDFLITVYPWTDIILVNSPKADAPPMIIICATDDNIGLAKGAIDLYTAWFDAGKSIAIHMYSRGDHGFGMKQQGLPSDTWIERVYDWMQVENLL